MSTPAALHAQLLHQARHLAIKEPSRPQQASLRRAVSTAYYALFHFLIDEACRIWVGAGARQNRSAQRSLALSIMATWRERPGPSRGQRSQMRF